MSGSDKSSVFHIIAFIFSERGTAREVENALRLGESESGYKIRARAIVEVDEKGKNHVHQPGRGGVGTTIGVIGGGLLALLGGPVGIIIFAIAGGAIGGVVGKKFFGRVIPEEDLEALGDQMQPNTSAILALIEDTASQALLDRMEDYNANVVTLTVGDEASGELAEYFAAEVDDNSDDGSDDSSDDSSDDTSSDDSDDSSDDDSSS